MGKKKKGKKKGGKKAKGGGGPIAERVHILPQAVEEVKNLQPEELQLMRKRLGADLEAQLKRRNRCQLERDTMQTFFDITKQQVRTLELEIEAEERIKEKLEENHAIEIKVYVQKAKELQCVRVVCACCSQRADDAFLPRASFPVSSLLPAHTPPPAPLSHTHTHTPPSRRSTLTQVPSQELGEEGVGGSHGREGSGVGIKRRAHRGDRGEKDRAASDALQPAAITNERHRGDSCQGKESDSHAALAI